MLRPTAVCCSPTGNCLLVWAFKPAVDAAASEANCLRESKAWLVLSGMAFKSYHPGRTVFAEEKGCSLDEKFVENTGWCNAYQRLVAAFIGERVLLEVDSQHVLHG